MGAVRAPPHRYGDAHRLAGRAGDGARASTGAAHGPGVTTAGRESATNPASAAAETSRDQAGTARCPRHRRGGRGGARSAVNARSLLAALDRPRHACGARAGLAVPSLNDGLDRLRVGTVSVPIAIGLLVMMYPVLARVRYEEIGGLRREWRLFGASLVLNWDVSCDPILTYWSIRLYSRYDYRVIYSHPSKGCAHVRFADGNHTRRCSGAARRRSPSFRVQTAPAPFERIALALQGGGALGSYQAGVYQALAEAAFTLTGLRAFRSARSMHRLIADNPPEPASIAS